MFIVVSFNTITLDVVTIALRRFKRTINRFLSFNQKQNFDNENKFSKKNFRRLTNDINELKNNDFVIFNQFEQRIDDRQIQNQRQIFKKIRVDEFRNKRDDKNLNFKYMTVRKFNKKFDLYKFSKFHVDFNICFHYRAYQYDKKCRFKSRSNKY